MKQCQTKFHNGFEFHQCQGILGHGGPCQDYHYQCVPGEQMTYPNGKNWCESQNITDVSRK